MSDKLAIIREFLRGNTEPQTLLAEVISVDEAERTCVVEMDETEYEDVRLYSVVKADLKGFVMIPKVGSKVLVSRIGNSNEMFVTMFSEVDKIMVSIEDKLEVSLDKEQLVYKSGTVELTIKNNEVTLKAEKIEFNGGMNSGLVKITELTDKINGLVNAFNKHTHTIPTAGVTAVVPAPPGTVAANTAPITVPATKSTVTTFKPADYENDKIKH